MRIGIDVDGVLADFNRSFIERVITVSGKDLFPPRPFDIPTWDYPEHYGYTPEETKIVWESIVADPTFWASLSPYPDTADFLSPLANRADDVYFITSRPGTRSKAQTERWLRMHGYHSRPTVMISSKKGLCAEALDLDFYLDDRDHNCYDVWDRRSPKTLVALMDRPWNKLLECDTYGIKRIYTLKEFAAYL